MKLNLTIDIPEDKIELIVNHYLSYSENLEDDLVKLIKSNIDRLLSEPEMSQANQIEAKRILKEKQLLEESIKEELKESKKAIKLAQKDYLKIDIIKNELADKKL